MRNVRFVWVRHGYYESLEAVKQQLQDFEPEIIGIEMNRHGLQQLLAYKHRARSEFFEAYKFAKKFKRKIVLMDTQKSKIMNKLDKEIGIREMIEICLRFCISNLKRLLKRQQLKKLSVDEVSPVNKYIVKERDEALSKKVMEVIQKNKGRKILFIFGKAHKKGILQRVGFYVR